MPRKNSNNLPPRVKDLRGRRFGRLKVLRFVELRRCAGPYRQAFWKCRCSCGKIRTLLAHSLLRGNTKSCGCYKRDLLFKHGMNDTRVHRIWTNMINRVTNPKHPSHASYFDRGIQICDRWRDFRNFLADMEQPPSPRHSIDRINNSKGYAPGNCRWATHKEQSSNLRTNRNISYRGQTLCLQAWADKIGLNVMTLRGRLEAGWPIKRALRQRCDARKRHLIRFRGKTLCLTDWARKLGIKKQTLMSRLTTYNWPVSRAFSEVVRNKISNIH